MPPGSARTPEQTQASYARLEKANLVLDGFPKSYTPFH